jgi:FixJ family two-component response regulator
MAEAIRALDERTPILLVSGYSDLEVEVRGRKMFTFLRKPFLGADLLRAVRDVLATPYC